MGREVVRAVASALAASLAGWIAVPGLAEERDRGMFPAWNECRQACDRQFERDMVWCKKDFRTFLECKQRAMKDYAECLAPCPPEPDPKPPVCPG